MNIVYFVLGVIAFCSVIFLLTKSEKIRNSKYWFIAYFGSLFVLSLSYKLIMLSGVIK